MRKPAWRFAVLIVGGALLLGSCSDLNFLQPSDDKAITTEIQSKLFQDFSLKTRDIRVVSQKGVVVLTGSVATELEKTAVEQIASQVKGVKQVVNQLTVSAPLAAAAQSAATLPATLERPPERARPAKRAAAAPRATEPPAPAETASLGPSAAPPKPAEPASAAPPPPPRPVRVTIPAGTVVTVRMIDSIDSARHRPGEEFAATVDVPVVVGDHVVIPRGSDARVRLVEARSAGHMTGRSELQLELVGLAVGSNTYAVESGVHEQVGASRGKRTATTVGGGAALGGLIGAIAGKGKGAAIGAAVGAGAGTAVQAATKGEQVRIPSETKLDFTLKVPITVTL